jgi:F0F1-type ATP synthase assembly protein I
MNPVTQHLELSSLPEKTLIIGLGNMGGNFLNSFVQGNSTLDNTALYINTDAQALDNSLAPNKLLIGGDTLKGMGTGTNPNSGRTAAAKSINQINGYINDADTICLVAGLGGGTGSGAIALIARHSMDLGKRVLCIVTIPFQFEGKNRASVANETILELNRLGVQKIVINNQALYKMADDKVTFADAFKIIDETINSKLIRYFNTGEIDSSPLVLPVPEAVNNKELSDKISNDSNQKLETGKKRMSANNQSIKQMYKSGLIKIGTDKMAARIYCYRHSNMYVSIQLASHILLLIGMGLLIYYFLNSTPINYIAALLVLIISPLAYMQFYMGCSIADNMQIIKWFYLLVLVITLPFLLTINIASSVEGFFGLGWWLIALSFFLIRFLYNLCVWVLSKDVISGKLDEQEMEHYGVVIAHSSNGGN